MAMFCPLCRVEYRDGFTRCSDCDVALVDHLPAAAAGGDPDAPTDADGRELLWSGLSTRLYEAIRDALDAAGIPHNDVEKEVGILPTFAQSAQLIWILPHDRDAARPVLNKVLAGGDPADAARRDANSDYLGWMDPFRARPDLYSAQSPAAGQEYADALADSAERTESAPDDIPADFAPEEATTEVWSGDDPDTAQFLKDSLSGVGVGCVLSEDGGKSRLLVLPADESRAKEIVREVVEGAPPE